MHKLRTALVVMAGLSFALPALAAAAPAAIVKRIPGPDGGWDLVSVDPATHQLFVARSDGVMVVDLRTGAVKPAFLKTGRLHGVLAVPGTNIGLATSGPSNTAILFDTRTGAVRAQLPTGASPDAVVYEPVSRRVWVMNAHDGTITIIDPIAAKAEASLTIGGGLELAALDGRGHLFVNIEDKNELVEVDLKRRTVMRRVALVGCDGPTGLALVHPAILISACANGVATLVKAASGKQIGSLAIGPGADGAFADPARGLAYIPSGGDGSLTVIDTRGSLPRVVQKLATQAGARTGTVDPSTGLVYLPTARFGPPAAPGQRPRAEPGSFELLVVGHP